MSNPNVALDTLARNLRVCYRFEPPTGYRRGKEQIKHLVMQMFDCSPRRARRLVEQMESGGFIYARGPRGERNSRNARWYFNPHPAVGP